METDDQHSSLFAGTAVELHLLAGIAVETINSLAENQDQHKLDMAKQAIRFLRMKAAKGDVEAKIKLSTILDRNNANLTMLGRDTAEATLWARSVFDRKLSAALAPCTADLIQLTESEESDCSLLDKLIHLAELESPGEDDPERKKKLKALRSMSYLVGILFVDGTGVTQDVDRGIRYLNKASDIGHETAGIELAKILGDPFKYPQQYNMEKSLAIYESVAEKQQQRQSQRRNGTMATVIDTRALTDLATVYYEGSDTVTRDIEKAYKYARRVAESVGEQYCQFIVGDILLKPPSSVTTIKQDIQQAIFWLTQSGEQGFPLAIETLSKIYFEGELKGFKKDYELAFQWCMKGDDIWPSGLGYCQTCLGDMYRQGLGVPKDQFRSFEYYQKAATQQDAPQNYARYMLGEL
ncbi:hypothetical protein BDB01DRAFT_842514 [Pilobolus umbonatus]|nr:hypothetical protein BDB01DRAFT_842514 [Pilobolus umbonatus]